MFPVLLLRMQEVNMLGRIHSLESFASSDGPSVRYLIFLQGCRMRCRFCHNPDTWDPSKGTMMRADEILDQAERYRSYWGKEGGITVSGGEPLLQMEFLQELFHKAKQRNINTCIDTALQPFTEEKTWLTDFQALMEDTDLLLVDIKHIDPDRHQWLTGCSNANIQAGMRYLSDIGKPIWIRHVLVPGVNDNEEYLEKTAQFISTLTNVKRIDVLPYHTLGVYKWKELGIPYTLGNVNPPDQETIRKAEEILQKGIRK